jgi:hypothetical protein
MEVQGIMFLEVYINQIQDDKPLCRHGIIINEIKYHGKAAQYPPLFLKNPPQDGEGF